MVGYSIKSIKLSTLAKYKYSQFQKSYAFSLNWDEYADKDAAIKCEDSFYLICLANWLEPLDICLAYQATYDSRNPK